MSEELGLSRRGVLQGAGWMLAATAVPAGATGVTGVAAAGTAADTAGATIGPQGISPAMAQLSAYMREAPARALPEEVLEKAARHILDTLAAMVSGSQLKPGQFAIGFARQQSTNKGATVAASNVVCDPVNAALANAMLAHSDETDDSHAPSQSHPGCAIVPAALAAAEHFGASGTQMLRAIVLGYDVGTRVTMTVGHGGFQTANQLSTHAVAGCFGAAAAAACMAGFDQQQMRWVLDYASQQASGYKIWQRDTQHIEKAFVFAAMPARSGLSAMLLVKAGATGVDDVFSGADNFLSVYGDHSDPATLVEKLGERYEVTRTNIKKWSVGSPIQAPLDAIENLRKRHPFTAAQVQEMVVRVAPSEGALVNNREMPDICLQYMLAVMLLDGTASFRAAHDQARMQDQAVQRERAKVKLVLDVELEKLLPARVAIVEVTLTSGAKLSERVQAVRGTEENPMTHAEVVAKCQELIAPVLGDAQCARLIDSVLTLERMDDVRILRPLLQRS